METINIDTRYSPRRNLELKKINILQTPKSRPYTPSQSIIDEDTIDGLSQLETHEVLALEHTLSETMETIKSLLA